ncbi:hypothetical protein NPX13_g5678 [Xylaria arbuscula]|uniref:PAS domain-containing protein n=1 Tax=Xylaria arbuscula TaxID=114810 RepID=A0A9W8ND95_9PEZI|nr:hypothetical protein NPX13_g5678 [Xylaria arbuscula]
MQPTEREPRAALILNRFTRTLTIMFATNAVSSILGIGPDELKGKSLYECIAENCWGDAIRCLESAKANDSIAYLRFWSRDPRVRQNPEENEENEEGDIDMEDQQESESENDSDGGVSIRDQPTDFIKREASSSPRPMAADGLNAHHEGSGSTSSQAQAAAPEPQRLGTGQQLPSRDGGPVPTRELEAVVSCTSDGLVMVLRRARPQIPSLHPPLLQANSTNGLFAAPWSEHPVRPNYPPELVYDVHSPYIPQYIPVREDVKAEGGPPSDQLMKSIRDVAVFAWALVGVNGNLASYAHGNPSGESQPPDGLPIWEPTASETSYLGPDPSSSSRYQYDKSRRDHQNNPIFPMYSPFTLGFEKRDPAHQHGSVDVTPSSRLGTSLWSNTMNTGLSQQPQTYPDIQQQQQQQQSTVTGYHNNHFQQRWTRMPTPHNRLNRNEDETPSTQSNSSGDVAEGSGRKWN